MATFKTRLIPQLLQHVPGDTQVGDWLLDQIIETRDEDTNADKHVYVANNNITPNQLDNWYKRHGGHDLQRELTPSILTGAPAETLRHASKHHLDKLPPENTFIPQSTSNMLAVIAAHNTNVHELEWHTRYKGGNQWNNSYFLGGAQAGHGPTENKILMRGLNTMAPHINQIIAHQNNPNTHRGRCIQQHLKIHGYQDHDPVTQADGTLRIHTPEEIIHKASRAIGRYGQPAGDNEFLDQQVASLVHSARIADNDPRLPAWPHIMVHIMNSVGFPVRGGDQHQADGSLLSYLMWNKLGDDPDKWEFMLHLILTGDGGGTPAKAKQTLDVWDTCGHHPSAVQVAKKLVYESGMHPWEAAETAAAVWV